ncbi:MAG: VCBS repeat-containing protein, partial [Candidatus Hadarchaeales archaeon]
MKNTLRVLVAVLLIFLSVSSIFSQSTPTISIYLTDNVVNLGEKVRFQGTAAQAGPLDNRLVGIYLDNVPQFPAWSKTTSADWWDGILENTVVVEVDDGAVRLGYLYDYDVFFRGNDGYLWRLDSLGQSENTGLQAIRSGGVGDLDGDGVLEVGFVDPSYYLYVLENGSSRNLGVQVVDVGGMGDFYGNGRTYLATLKSGWILALVDNEGNATGLGIEAQAVGWMADFDGDGDLDLFYVARYNDTYPYGLKCVDRYGNVRLVENSTGGWIKIGDVGGVADFDGDGDLDVLCRLYDSPYQLVSVDNAGNVRMVTDGVGAVGGVLDFDGDGDADVAFTQSDTLKFADRSGNILNTGRRAYDVGGIADIDLDTGYFTSGKYTATHDWESPHVRCENIEINASIALQTSLALVVEVSDDNFTTVKENQLLSLSSGVITYPLSLPSARYVRLKFLFSSSSSGNTPTLHSFTLNGKIYTDSSGNYSYWLPAPSLGTHEIRVTVENGGASSENSASFDVRRLVFDSFFLLDSHGQLDNILNPGENYRLTVRIREDNSSQFYEVTS